MGTFIWATAPVTVQISEQGSGDYTNRLCVQLHILFCTLLFIRQIPSVWDQCIHYIILEQASYILKKSSPSTCARLIVLCLKPLLLSGTA